MRAWFALMLVAIGCDGPPLTPGRISDERAYRTVDGGAPPRRECVETAVTLIRALRWDDCRDLDGPSGDFSVMTFFNPDGTVREARFDAHGYLRADGRMIPVPVSTALTGTPRGDCVLAHFAAVKIPPFEGAPFSVRLNFILD